MSEWKMVDREDIRSRFGYVEVFIDWFCGTCPDGNLELDVDKDFCPTQVNLGTYGEAAEVQEDGTAYRCTRRDAMEKAERDKYERRMSGDWT